MRDLVSHIIDNNKECLESNHNEVLRLERFWKHGHLNSIDKDDSLDILCSDNLEADGIIEFSDEENEFINRMNHRFGKDSIYGSSSLSSACSLDEKHPNCSITFNANRRPPSARCENRRFFKTTIAVAVSAVVAATVAIVFSTTLDYNNFYKLKRDSSFEYTKSINGKNVIASNENKNLYEEISTQYDWLDKPIIKKPVNHASQLNKQKNSSGEKRLGDGSFQVSHLTSGEGMVHLKSIVSEKYNSFYKSAARLEENEDKSISGYVMDIMPFLEKESQINLKKVHTGDYLAASLKIEKGKVVPLFIAVRAHGMIHMYMGDEWKSFIDQNKEGKIPESECLGVNICANYVQNASM